MARTNEDGKSDQAAAEESAMVYGFALILATAHHAFAGTGSPDDVMHTADQFVDYISEHSGLDIAGSEDVA